MAKFELLKMGADPEVFVEKRGKLLPAYSFLPKQTRDAVIFADGFAQEFVVDAGHCLEVRVGDIARKLLYRIPQGATLSKRTAFYLSDAELASAPAWAAELGCEPSLNVYGRPPLVVNDEARHWRFAGGHIHFGISAPTALHAAPHVVRRIVRALDSGLGIASVGLAEGIDHPLRRKYYGRAGEFRLPRHGLEYRTLSNFWLWHPAISHLVLEMARACVRKVTNPQLFGAALVLPAGLTQSVINDLRVQEARTIVDKHHEYFASLVPPDGPAAVEAILSGIKEILPSGSIRQNWQNPTCTWRKFSYKHL